MDNEPVPYRYSAADARRDLATLTQATTAPGARDCHRRLGEYLEWLELLKAAGDVLVHEASHPTRKGNRLLLALVEYRRIAER